METKLICLGEFRKKLPQIWRELADLHGNTRYLVLVHSKPVLEIRPTSLRHLKVEKLLAEVELARNEHKIDYLEIFNQYGLYEKI